MTTPIHQLPKRYDKAKKKKDEDGEEYVMIDRIYGSIFKGGERLLQADGTVYKGKLYSKRRLVTSKDPITKEKKNIRHRVPQVRPKRATAGSVPFRTLRGS